MSIPTAVNDQITDSVTQITDAVTQANVKVIGEAPAIAMGSIYQSLAHSIGILFENAVTTQQQQNILMQSAVTQGVILMYELDTAGANAPDRLQTQVQQSVAELENAAMAGGVSSQIVDAVKLSLHSVLDSAGDFSYGVRCAAQAMQKAIDELGETSHREGLRTLQLSATAICLRLMIANPEKADAYAGVLDTIQRLR